MTLTRCASVPVFSTTERNWLIAISWPSSLLVGVSVMMIKYYNSRGDDKKAFLGSAGYLAFMLGGAVFGLFPIVLPALDPANHLTVYNAKAGEYGLAVGLIWWTIAMIIALGYYTFLFRTFRGKVSVGDPH